jgi:hypothetical protein
MSTSGASSNDCPGSIESRLCSGENVDDDVMLFEDESRRRPARAGFRPKVEDLSPAREVLRGGLQWWCPVLATGAVLPVLLRREEKHGTPGAGTPPLRCAGRRCDCTALACAFPPTLCFQAAGGPCISLWGEDRTRRLYGASLP